MFGDLQQIVSAGDVIAEAGLSLVALAYVRLGIPPEEHERYRDLEAARVLIDALGGMLAAVEGRVGAAEPGLRGGALSIWEGINALLHPPELETFWVGVAVLVAALVGRAMLPVGVQALLLERAGGNPLYAEEFARLLDNVAGVRARAEAGELMFGVPPSHSPARSSGSGARLDEVIVTPDAC